MELNEYQEKAMGTCMPSSNNFSYMALNLVGEVGELMSKIAKHVRKDEAEIFENRLMVSAPYVDFDAIKAELGDIMWQLSGLCDVMGFSLEEVCAYNLEKLASRKERNVIDGNGDDR